MKITVNTGEAARAAKSAAALTDPMAHASLGGLLLEATGKTLRITGGNGESRMVCTIEADVDVEGSCLVPASVLADVLGSSDEPNLMVHYQGQKVEVSDVPGGSLFSLLSIPHEDYPEWYVPPADAKAEFTIESKDLESLSLARYATAKKGHRKVLMGIFADSVEHGTLRVTATDGKKLSRIHRPINGDLGGVTSILPANFLSAVVDLATGTVAVEMSERSVRCSGEGWEVSTLCIVGKYPDCNKVIPEHFPHVVPIDGKKLLREVRRASVTADERNRSIVMKISKNRIDLTSYHHDLGSFSGSVLVDYTGPAIEMAFNHAFLVETLSKLPSSDVLLHVAGKNRPVIYEAKDDNRQIGLMMPIKLSDLRRDAEEKETE